MTKSLISRPLQPRGGSTEATVEEVCFSKMEPSRWMSLPVRKALLATDPKPREERGLEVGVYLGHLYFHFHHLSHPYGPPGYRLCVHCYSDCG